jgi:hypothetical protein
MQLINFCTTLYLPHTCGRNKVKAVTLRVRNPRKLNVYVVAKQRPCVLTVLMNYKHLHPIYFMQKVNILTHVDNEYLIMWERFTKVKDHKRQSNLKCEFYIA